MKKFLFIFFCANLFFSQTNNTLQELGIIEIKLGEKKDNINLTKGGIFKEISFKKNDSNEIESINLQIDKKSVKQNREKIIESLEKNFGKPYANIDSNYFFFRKNLEKALFNISNISGMESSLHFHRYNPLINEKFDEFTNTKYFFVDSEGYDDLYALSGSTFYLKFMGSEKESVKNVFLIIRTKNENWKFIEKVTFLNDGKTFDISAKSDREIDKSGFTKEVSVISLSKNEIDQILESKTSKIRISGKVNDDLEINDFIKESLKSLVTKMKM